MKRLLSWLVGLLVVALRMTCRFEVHNDPRGQLKLNRTPHVFAALHAHQVAAGMAADRGTGAMVSRSEDGQIIVPALRWLGHIPIRGSGGSESRKGGAAALQSLVKHVAGGRPAILAVDGPKGPRGRVHRGIGMLAKKTDAVVLAVVVIPRRRWILSKTWDRLQIPQPFTKINAHFAAPLILGKDEKLSAFAGRVEAALSALEQEFDPEESRLCPASASKQNEQEATRSRNTGSTNGDATCCAAAATDAAA